MDPIIDFAENAERTHFENISADAVKMTKLSILDTLGTTLAGSRAPGIRAIVDRMTYWGGKEEATVFVYGGRVPAPNAAFLNSVMSHALNFDGTHDGAGLHANAVVLPAALACVESLGGVSGKTLIAAIALGVDITCRIGLALAKGSELTRRPRGFLPTTVCGIFGAALACGKLLGLDAGEIRNGMGIAFSQASGNYQAIVEPTLSKKVQPGFSAMAGTLSAILAKKGITGAIRVLEGKYGFFNLYWNGEYSKETLLEGLGQRWEGVNLSFNPYLCCRHAIGSIEATLKIVLSHNISPPEVSEVRVHLPALKPFNFVSHQFDIKPDPQVSDQYGIPYTTAVAILRKVSLEDFKEEIIQDPRVKELSQKVRVIQDLDPEGRGFLGPAAVEIQTSEGKVFCEEIRNFKGSPERPLSMQEIREKFLACSRFSARLIQKDKLHRLIEAVEELEKIENVKEIFSSLMVAESA